MGRSIWGEDIEKSIRKTKMMIIVVFAALILESFLSGVGHERLKEQIEHLTIRTEMLELEIHALYETVYEIEEEPVPTSTTFIY